MTIANCQTLERICATAGSDLYRGRRLTDGMPVLLKLPAEHADAAQLARLRREYLLLRSLNVAGIAKPLALVDERGHLALVLEAFSGESLEAVLGRDLRMDLVVFLRIGRHLADALAGIDAAQVIHRDIRPANILVAPATGEVLLVDFSMATAQESSTFSPEGAVVPAGDWAYVSPEQTGRMNRPVDYRTDCYSMGVLLYRMLTGQLPFQANDPLEWTHCHIARTPAPPGEFAPEVPQTVSDIVMKLLAKLPEDRYQSACGLQADLDRCLAQWQASGRIESFPLGTEDVPERFHVPHKLYGRGPEVEQLLGAFERTAATGQAALATVSGYSGIGKSSLVDALRKPIVVKHGYFAAGKFDQYQRDIPYATMTQAFRELVRQLLAESEARIAGWRQQIQAAVGINGQLIIDVLPQVEIIIGPQSPVPALPPTETQNRFRMVFRQFVTAFTSEDHPLVLFLDDLQWIDAASLALIEHLLTHPETRYLLLIGAYRDNEVSAAHPLITSLQTIRRSGAPVMDLPLMPPSAVHLNQLVADALHAPPASCESLTQLVCERTEGNPFFFIQFLDALHKEGLLRHDAQHRAWQWDLDQIKEKDFADNVVDLMVGKLRQLPVPAQHALQLAACLGNTFDLRHLALVSAHSEAPARQRLSEAEVEQGLAAAVRESLIVHTDGRGKFLHDRIQQAAYSLIPQASRVEVHLRIGRALLASMTADELAEHVFDLANQFNRGAALLIERDEKAQVAALNLRAGHRAKASAAYASACVYLAAGMALLDDSDWSGPYGLMFSLWLERAECEFLNGRIDLAESLIEELLRRGASKVDQAAVYHLKVQLHIVRSENPQAVDSVLACLRLFGIDLPAHPTREQVQAEYETVWRNLAGRPIESLIDLPLMSDPQLQAAMRLLSALFDAAYFTDFHLFCLHLCRMVNVSLQHGMTGASAHACGFLGFVLGPVFHRYSEGYLFAKLGCDLVEKHGFLAYQAKVHYAMGQVAVWTQPIANAIDCNRAAFRTAIETGDLTFACYSMLHIIAERLVRNDPLDAVWRESEWGMDFVRKARYRDVADLIASLQRLIATLQGRTATFSTFSDAQFDEAAFEAQLTGDRIRAMVCGYWIHKLQARFLAGDYLAALAAFQQAKPMLQSLVGHIPCLDYFYYTALTVAALYENASADEQAGWRDLLTVHCEQLREWAENYPPTFGDKHALVSAEIARVEGRDADAMRLYEEAIQAAREHGFVQNEGIAHELAAGFYVARGSTTAARAHLDEARGCFARWGAHGKVRQIDERTPPLRAPSASSSASRSATSPSNVAQLDLLSVAKASQAISGQIVLEDLVDTLMHILLENAGAQTGQLLLARNGSLVLAAEASVEQQTIRVRRHLDRALAEPTLPEPVLCESVLPEPAWPTSIVNYVRRCQERVLLADATQANPFSADDYVVRRQPKSLLCLPLMRRSALIGLLYLENNLATHAFTPERVTVLELLASQAAISLENALLYADLQQENSERKRAEEALRERDARIRRIVDSNIIGLFFWDFAGTATEANDAFLQIVGYSRQDLLSGLIQWPRMTPPEYRAADAQAMEVLRRAGTCQPYEKEYIRKDGRRIPVLVGGALLEGSQENGVAFVLDLTERREAEAERAARRVAEAANQAKNVFLANISHELRTPLNGILGYAQILRRDATLDQRRSEGLNVIQHSGEQLLTLINDILDFAKIEAGKLELSLTDITLAKFLRIIAEIIDVRARQKGLDFVCDFAPTLPQGIRTDESRLRQVLLNLLANAVKFTDQGWVSLRVCFSPPGRLRFEVHDTGIGVGADQLETIFQPFEQVNDPQRRLGGAGLGLAISRQFVRLMSSDIHVTSQIGVGSTFWFELEVPVIETGMTALPERFVTGYAGPRKKVLVVDDVAENRAMAVDMVSQLGFAVVEAVNGFDALVKARARRPDWILMDLVMPGLDGLEATRRLRQLPGLGEVPIIVMSASVSGSDEQKSLAAGANAFLPKPIDLDQLLTQIAALLKLSWTDDYEPQAALSEEDKEVRPLVVPPQQDMERLRHLARSGNMRDIVQWAGRVAELDERYRPFADQLRLLAKGYQSKAILTLVERYLES
jgi:PAS domain S-box-containing protein